MEPISSWTDPAIRALERSDGLNAIGKWVSNTFHGLIGTGRTKEALAGTWMAHPAHPMLTDVTIGAWTSAAILDALGGEKARPGADFLAGIGILSAVPTALTGLSDLTDIVDPENRSLGTAHALANVGTLALWSLSYVARKTGSRRAAIALSMAASAVMTGAGFLGGHLSFRKGVGVDQTAFDPPIEDWTAAIAMNELKDGQPRRVMVAGRNLFLLRRGERVHALANRCTHRGGPLHKGSLGDDGVTCPWHLSTFRLEDGSVLRGPATAPQPTYRARIRGGQVEVRGPDRDELR